jgi:hypothetical protein
LCIIEIRSADLGIPPLMAPGRRGGEGNKEILSEVRRSLITAICIILPFLAFAVAIQGMENKRCAQAKPSNQSNHITYYKSISYRHTIFPRCKRHCDRAAKLYRAQRRVFLHRRRQIVAQVPRQKRLLHRALSYVSDVSIIFYAPCLFIHHLLCVLLHFMAFLCIFWN